MGVKRADILSTNKEGPCSTVRLFTFRGDGVSHDIKVGLGRGRVCQRRTTLMVDWLEAMIPIINERTGRHIGFLLQSNKSTGSRILSSYC